METRRAGPPRGFTLVELLIVITIIALLLVWLIVAVAAAGQQAKNANTQALIDKLKAGVVRYQQTYGSGRDYPPMVQTGASSSMNLDRCLLRNVRIWKAFAGVTAALQMPGMDPMGEEMPPLVRLEESSRRSGLILDFWDRPILYFGGGSSDPFTGNRFHDAVIPSGQYHFDIVSEGPYAGGLDPDGKDCRIATFKNKSEVQ